MKNIIFFLQRKVREDKVTLEKEVLWNVVEIFSFDIAMEYAMNNREKGKDFRRALFKKELEIYSIFGEQFEKRKKNELDEILKRNPYNDI